MYIYIYIYNSCKILANSIDRILEFMLGKNKLKENCTNVGHKYMKYTLRVVHHIKSRFKEIFMVQWILLYI